MLQQALSHEADFGNWNVTQQASWLNELSLIYEALGRHRDQLAAAERGLAQWRYHDAHGPTFSYKQARRANTLVRHP